MDQMTVGKDVGAVLQAVSILRAIAAAEAPMGVTAIARAAGVSPSTTLNILRTLISQRLVGFSAHAKTYRLDVGLLELARSLLNRTAVDLLLPQLQDVARRFEATVTVWQAQGERHTLVGRVVPEEGIHIEFPIVSRVSAYAGATGRMIFAAGQLSDEEIRRAIESLKWNSPVPLARYLKEVRQARRTGYAVDAGDFLRSVTSVAAVMLDGDAQPRLAISVHTFLGQLTGASVTELGETLNELCRRDERALFGKKAP